MGVSRPESGEALTRTLTQLAPSARCLHPSFQPQIVLSLVSSPRRPLLSVHWSAFLRSATFVLNIADTASKSHGLSILALSRLPCFSLSIACPPAAGSFHLPSPRSLDLHRGFAFNPLSLLYCLPAMLRRTRRAPKACSWCHHRKVRCDASIRGCPCTRCRQDGRPECVLRGKLPRK